MVHNALNLCKGRKSYLTFYTLNPYKFVLDFSTGKLCVKCDANLFESSTEFNLQKEFHVADQRFKNRIFHL